MKGTLITLEGIDLAGKTTVIELLVPMLTRLCTVPVVHCGELRSPIAAILVEMLNTGASPFVKTFMFAADRAWTYEHMFLPAFEQGSLIIWDRYVDSAIVYRAAELEESKSLIDLDFVEAINQPFLTPDLTVYIDIDVNTSFVRGRNTGGHIPYTRDILERVGEQYMLLRTKRNYRIVDGKQPLSELALEIFDLIQKEFPVLFI